MVQTMKRDANGNMTLDTYALDSNDPNLIGPEQVSSKPLIDLNSYGYSVIPGSGSIVNKNNIQEETPVVNTGPSYDFSNKFGGSTTETGNPFMDATMAMLKYAQGGMTDISKNYAKSQSELQAAAQYGEDRGWRASAAELQRQGVDPRNYVSLMTDAGQAYKPSVLSAERQMQDLTSQYNAQNQIYGNISDTATKLRDQEQARLNALETKRANLAAEQINAYKAANPGTSTSNKLAYTSSELKKLREAGISSTDIAAADAYLYGESTDINYSDTELKKLRAAMIDPTDTVKADNYLYNKGAANIDTTTWNLQKAPVAEELFKKIRSSTDVDENGDYIFPNLSSLYEEIDATDTINVDGQDVYINDTMKQQLKDEIELQRTWWNRLIPGGK